MLSRASDRSQKEKSNFAGFLGANYFAEKSANFAGVFGANFIKKQLVNNGRLCGYFQGKFG